MSEPHLRRNLRPVGSLAIASFVVVVAFASMAAATTGASFEVDQVVGDDDCRDIVLRGSNVAAAGGTIEIAEDRPAPLPDVKLEEHPWTGVAQGDGRFSLNAGPFDPAVKAGLTVRVLDASGRLLGSIGPFNILCAPVLDCPPDVRARVSEEGILLTWGDVDGANVFEVRRDPSPVPTGNPVAFTGSERRFLDAVTERGATFEYVVDAFGPDLARSEDCLPIRATSIPFFASPLAVATGAAGALAAFVAMRVRRL